MVSGRDLVVFLAQRFAHLSSLISPHTDRARETLRGGKAAASLAKPLLGKRGEIAPLSAPPHTRLYSKEDSQVLLEYGHSIHHQSFPRELIEKSFPVCRQGRIDSVKSNPPCK